MRKTLRVAFSLVLRVCTQGDVLLLTAATTWAPHAHVLGGAEGSHLRGPRPLEAQPPPHGPMQGSLTVSGHPVWGPPAGTAQTSVSFKVPSRRCQPHTQFHGVPSTRQDRPSAGGGGLLLGAFVWDTVSLLLQVHGVVTYVTKHILVQIRITAPCDHSALTKPLKIEPRALRGRGGRGTRSSSSLTQGHC